MRKVKLFFTMLMLIAFSVGNVWGEDAAFAPSNFSGQGTSGSGSAISATVDGVTFACDKGYGTTQFRCYSGGKITISSSNTITAVSFTFSGSYTGGLETSYTGLSTTSWEKTLSSQARITACTVTYSAGGAKTLTGVTVSGNPSKTSYEAGEEFDPTGLTVTGSYSDATTAPISSGITWTYNPSQTLVKDQTSIWLIVTVSEIAKAESNVTGLTLTAASPKITITATSSGISTSYGDDTFTQSGVTFSYKQWMKSTNFIQAKASQNPSLKNTTPISGVIKSITVVTGEGKTARAVTVKGGTTSSSLSTITAPSTDMTMVFDFGSNEYPYFELNTPGNACYFDKIVIEYREAAAVAAPTISGEESFLESTEVTLACTTDGATIYYSTDGSDPKTSGTTGTSFTLFNDATVRAIAKKDEAWSEEATPKAFTKKTPITVAQALDIIEALPNKTATTEDYLVEGTISTITSVTVGGTAEYYISADGTTTNELQVYKGKYKNQANFTSVDDIQEGDDVVIYGKLKKYNTYKELDQDNYVYSQKAKARLSWSAASYTASMSGGNSFPILTNTNEVAVTYSSSDPSVASFTNASDYSTLTLNAAGTGVTITATFEGNSTYKANTATYTLNVEAAVERGTITFDVDGGDAIASIPDATELPNPLPIPTKAGKNFVAWFTNSGKTDEAVAGAAVTEDITLYAKWREPYTITEALAIIATYGNNEGGTNDVYVAGIVSTAPSSNPSSGRLTYSISADGTASDEIKVYLGKGVDDDPFSNKTDVQLNDKVIVYGKLYKYEKNSEITPEVNTPNYLYSLSRKAEAELDWSASSAVVGITGDKDYPAIVNPHSVTGIKYSSSDPTVASFADENAYSITLHKAGTVTITATFDGDEDYKNDEASYTLEVRDVLVYVTITYECDGATTGCPDPATIENQTNIPNPLPTVTKDGFKFGGWFTNAGKTEAATAGAALMGDVTLYAKWIEIPTFDNSGYEWQLVTSDAQLVADQYYVMGRAANSAVASNTLSGGYLSKVAVTYTDGGIAYNGFATAPTTKTANEAGVAVFLLGGNSTDGWTLTEVLGAETGLLGGAGSTSFAWGGNYTVWPITIDGSGEAVIGTASAERVLYNVSSPRFKPYGAGTQTSPNMPLPQLYVWAEKTFKLRYDANEGTNAPTATPATAGKAVVTDAKPTAPTGKIFDGWNENASGTGANYAAGDEVTVSGADVTIYAKWRDPVDYTVSYNANGGTLMEGKSDIDPQDVTEGNQVTVAVNVYEKEGFVFGGWKLGENIYYAGQKFTMPAENVELVAQWNSLTLTDYILVTNVNQLLDGDKVYIVSAENNTAMSTKNSTKSYYDYVEIQKSADNSHVVLSGEEPLELTLGKGEDYFTFNDGTGYLCATSSSSNDMSRQTTLDANGKWTITITDGVASVIAQGDKNRKDMRYNSNSGQGRFTCYATSTDYTNMKAVAIYKKADYTRAATEGRYGTICLPQAGQIIGATLYEVADKDDSKIYFDEILNGQMEAGNPYIFLPNSGESQLAVLYTSDVVETAKSVNGLVGFIGANADDETEVPVGMYILNNNQYRLVERAGSAKIKSYRSYIDLDAISSSMPAPGRRRISMSYFGSQVATGIENAEANEAPRKVLINGEMFILRGEKMYDAKGQLVK